MRWFGLNNTWDRIPEPSCFVFHILCTCLPSTVVPLIRLSWPDKRARNFAKFFLHNRHWKTLPNLVKPLYIYVHIQMVYGAFVSCLKTWHHEAGNRQLLCFSYRVQIFVDDYVMTSSLTVACVFRSHCLNLSDKIICELKSRVQFLSSFSFF